jgi:hypothetical protein
VNYGFSDLKTFLFDDGLRLQMRRIHQAAATQVAKMADGTVVLAQRSAFQH